MIDFIQIDTQEPPLWSGTKITITPHIDAVTALRPTTGDDKVNKFVQQRVEGDLFNRDLALSKNVQGLIDHLSNRGGLIFNCPMIYLPSNKHIVLGEFGDDVSEVPSWYIVALSAKLSNGATNGSVGTKIVQKSTSIILGEQTAVSNTDGWGVNASGSSDRPTIIVGDSTLQVILYNESASPVTVTGYAIVRPLVA